MGAATIVGGLLTEEGFFRGWLWAALENCGFTSGRVVFLTSLAFAAWHVSAVVLPTGFDLPARQVPIFLANVMAIGTAWGLMRRASRSIVVTSVSHSVWNGLAYSFFGFGTKTGVLGVTAPDIWGPEVGVAGLVLNIAFVAVLWRTSRDHLRGTTPASSD
jgi:membrane protease YdiL (CAAX protease family)